MSNLYRIQHPRFGWFAGFDHSDELPYAIFENQEEYARSYRSSRHAKVVLQQLEEKYAFCCEMKTFQVGAHRVEYPEINLPKVPDNL